ncbi:hypothetical protein [Streptomyces cinereospinus]|uniref:Uncharacterized protein n=1 Tax=Streptomyces cinereospinus TaxID=285561 RepID=A0ABV5N8T5_9ACTN
MFRGTALRPLFTTLVAALLALPLFASPAPFAAAHTARHIEAEAHTGTIPSGTAPHVGGAAFHVFAHPGDPTGPLRIRDRHHSVDSAPCARPCARPARDTGADIDAAVPSVAYDRTSRPSTAHAPAALQVVRS